MHTIDWVIVTVPLLLVTCIGLYTRRFVKSVADFMAGGRNAGRYLLCTSRGEMTAGAALFVAMLEQFSRGGFAFTWWNSISISAGLLIGISGFVVYRYRQTRALTLAQFFEMRYSRNFRLFAGSLGFLAGLVNFGVIPAVGARFFVYFLQLPASLHLGPFEVPTYLLLMACFLGTSVLLTTAGGQVTALVTDCVEGMYTQICYVGITLAMILMISWPAMREVLLAQPRGQSMVNPFDTFSTKDFNLWYVLMAVCLNIYGTMAWQNSHAFNSSALTPHDARMGVMLGQWRALLVNMMTVLLAACTLTFLQHPSTAEGANQVREIVSRIPDQRVADQMYWPIGLSTLLPIGIKGILCSIMLMGVISGDGMHLHSWSSIFVQDVIVPLRKRPLETRQHLRLLRLAIIGVALFAFCFGALFRQTDKLFLWWMITQTIYVGGAGAAIIGGLYWNRGTTAGAWVGMISGSMLCISGILLRQWHPNFPLNAMQISIVGAAFACISYVLISLMTCRKPHNMEELLHRGKYAVEPESVNRATPRTSWFARFRGIDQNFSRTDRWVAGGLLCWSLFWITVFSVGSAWYLLRPWSDETWTMYWRVISIWLPLALGVATVVWFTIGCVRDMRIFFQRLRTERVDVHDDGTVEPKREPAPLV